MRYTISVALASLLASTALAEVPAVVTDIAPVHSLVAMVMGDLGTPALLLEKGADPHDFQLRPSQAQAVADAGLVVWIGPEMSPWLERALDGTGTNGTLLALLSAAGTETRSYGKQAGEHDHAAEGEDHDHDHDHGHGHDHVAEGESHDQDAHAKGEGHDHSHTGTDPHAWLDPHNAILWMGVIAGELGRLDPANAVIYAENAELAAVRINAMEADLQATLAPVHDKPFVVFHDAFGYFAAHFGLTVAGAISAGDAASPGAQSLRDLTRTAAAGTICIFPEANHDAALSAQMAEATGATLGAPLDPEGVTLDPGPDLYPALMTGLAGALADCLSR